MPVMQIELEFHTEDQTHIQICELYWSTNSDGAFTYTVSALEKHFKLKTGEAKKISSANSTAYSASAVCSRCGTPYIFNHRSDYTERLRAGIPNCWKCSECLEIERGEELERHKAIFEKRHQVIRERYSLKSHEQKPIMSLTLEDAVYLLSMIRHGATEDFSRIVPIKDFRESLMPMPTGENNDHDLAVHLIQRQLLLPHPESSPDSFIWEGPNEGNIYTKKIIWGWPLGASENGRTLQDLAAELETMFRDRLWLEPWREQWLSLWQKIALQECLEYLTLVMKEHHLTHNPGPKTNAVISELLETYAVGQVWRIVWTATTNAIAYRERSGIPKAQAANSVVGGMQRYGENARANGWMLKPFRRERRCPQSIVSQVFFNAVVQLGDEYLNVVGNESISSAVVP
jgi:hypothetical protein